MRDNGSKLSTFHMRKLKPINERELSKVKEPGGGWSHNGTELTRARDVPPHLALALALGG